MKRRKVVRVIFTYLIVGWLLIQVADVTIDPLHLPQWSNTLVIWLVGLGFPIAIALAWAGLTYVFVDTYWYRDKEAKWIEQAHEASQKAIELAPHLAESHGARGYAFFVHEQYDKAETEFEKAIAINPRLFELIHFHAQMARILGQYQKAADLYCRAAKDRACMAATGTGCEPGFSQCQVQRRMLPFSDWRPGNGPGSS